MRHISKCWRTGLWSGLLFSIAVSPAYAQLVEYPTPGYPSKITTGPDGALWFTESHKNSSGVAVIGYIGRITTSGSITEYALPTQTSSPAGITTGPDGALWFTESYSGKIGRISTSGSITEHALPNAEASPNIIVAGPDAALWFTEGGANNIGRITTDARVTEFAVPTPPVHPATYKTVVVDLTAGPDGALWFTEGTNAEVGKIGRITVSGSITEYLLPSGLFPAGITTGPDGALWFTAEHIPPGANGSTPFIGRITTSGTVSEYELASTGGDPYWITTGPDSALWFSDGYAGNGFGAIEMITTSGSSEVPGVNGPQLEDISGITSGPDGALWFANGQIGRYAPLILTSLSPASNVAGGATFSLTVTGNGFASGAVVEWNDSPLSTTYVSATQLTASVPANLIALAGTAKITVDSGGFTSNTVTFTINAALAVTALNPPSVPAGGPPLTLTVSGSGFTPGAVVEWNGSPLSTTFIGSTEITASVPASLIESQGMVTVTVALNGGDSARAEFTVTAPQSSQCANIGGTWNVSESGSASFSIVAPIESDSFTNQIGGSGSVTITQVGCSFEYLPLAEEGLIGTNLTPSQLASTVRSGTVSGNNVSATGIVAVVDTVQSTQSGVTITDVSSNLLTANGQLAGNVLTLNETGNFEASGTYSLSGQTGSLKLTITTMSTAVFTRSSIVATVTPTALNFQVSQGGLAQSQNVQIGGTAGTTWQATAASPTGWLSVSPASGQIPASLTVSVSAVNLSPGTYQGSVTVQTPGATPTSSTVSVTLTVNAPGGRSGVINTIAGNRTAGFSGDGGPAISAALNSPQGMALDASGNLFFADYNNNRIRKVSSIGIITTVAGNGTQGYSGDGGPALSAELYHPEAVAVDASGNLFIADAFNNRIRKVSVSGVITTVAGNGTRSFSGDGGPATSASLSIPLGVAVDASGNLFIADAFSDRIRKVSVSGVITTVAGNGAQGFSGDGGPAVAASLNVPNGVAVDASGNLFIADSNNRRVRRVSPNGVITTVAGNGSCCFSGDGGSATAAELFSPTDVAVDASGNLYIADLNNGRIRQVSPSGVITTIAGDGSDTYSGDGGPAISAGLGFPGRVAVAASGNYFIADATNSVIREVSSGMSISVTNDASFATQISPGSLATVFGNGNELATKTVPGFSLPLPTSKNGTFVTINGIPCPLIYVSASQINLQAPMELEPGTANVVVNNNGQMFSTTVRVLTAAPGIFTTDYYTKGGVAILQDSATGTVLNSNHPAVPGQNVTMYFTGIGPVTNNPGTGNAAPLNPLSQSTSAVSVTVNGISVEPSFTGLTSGLVGLGQVNFQLPANTPAGNTIPVVLIIDGVSSKPVHISVN